MATKLTTPVVTEPLETAYFRYLMDEPEDLLDTNHVCWMNPELPVMIDVETHRKDYNGLRTVQMYQKGWPAAVIFDTNHTDPKDIYALLENQHVVSHMATMEISCFQNALKPADMPWSQYKPVNPFKRFSDTFLLARRALYNKIDGFSLDIVAKFIHGRDFYAEYAESLGWVVPKQYKKYMQKSFLDTPKSNKQSLPLHFEQLLYASLDVLVMPDIYEALKKEENHFIIQLDYAFINRCVEYQHHGLPLDLKILEEQKTGVAQLMKDALDTLPAGLNPRSYVQVRKLLNSVESDDTYLARVVDGSDMVVAPLNTSGAGVDGMMESVDLYYDDPEHAAYRKACAEALRSYRSAVKRQEYLTAYEKQHDKFGVVRGYVSPRTISGRIASDEVNMTNIPRSLKYLFGYPEEGTEWLIYADFSQLELRMLAAVLNEHVMIRKFMEDEDLHVFAATNIYEKTADLIEKHERFIGKFFNFSGAYGAGVARLCTMLLKNAGIFMEEEDMRPLHRKWKSTFPAMAAWHASNGRSKTNEDVTLSGRWYKAKLYTDLNAIKMQGSAAEVFKLASIYMARNRNSIRTGAAVHDSFVHVRAGFTEAQTDAFVTVWSMVVAWFEVIQNAEYPYLKMPTSAYVGKNWGYIDNDGKYAYAYEVDGNYLQYKAVRDAVCDGKLLTLSQEYIKHVESLVYEDWR